MSVFDPNFIHPKGPHHLSYGGLNRNDMARRDSGLIKRLLAQLETRYIIVWRGLNLFKSDITGSKSMRWLTIEAVSSFLDEAICIYLGKDRSQVEYVCLDISKYPEDKLGPLSDNGQFGDLREADPSISGDDGSVLAYAKAMCHWHAHSEYCSVCGSFALSSEAGHTRKCSNLDCAVVHFPRTDPAVIVAVTFEDKILLGRQAVWPKGMFSVLAGFVEPGETLEHAVAREVYERQELSPKMFLISIVNPGRFLLH